MNSTFIQTTALAAITHCLADREQEDPFFIADLDEVRSLVDQWNSHLPSVAAFFAVKCNPDPKIIKVLAEQGVGFDCASKTEMQLVLGLGISPSKIIFANPHKQGSHIAFARDTGITRLTFDCVDEVEKIAEIHPQAELVLRLSVDSTQASIGFSNKFGATFEEAKEVLKAAKELNMKFVGVAFHVGSGCKNPKAYDWAIRDAKKVFLLAKTFGFSPTLLDIGGGFNGRNSERASLMDIVKVINKSISDHFSDVPNLEMIAEPGRYFAASVFTLAARVCSKRKADGLNMYYINDGVHGSLRFIRLENYLPKFDIFHTKHKQARVSDEVFPSCIWGPTCDAGDLLIKQRDLPDINVGDWIIFSDLGAYASSCASSFNGFSPGKVFYINE